MLLRWKLLMARISTWWSTRLALASKCRTAEIANVVILDQSNRNDTEADRVVHQRDQLQVELHDAQQQIEVLQGTIDVIKVQLDLSSTIIASYQAVEETRIAISTADRIRALAEPVEEGMQ